MDRTAFAACAVMLVSLGPVAGCGTNDTPQAAVAEKAPPQVMCEPQDEAPRPLRRPAPEVVVTVGARENLAEAAALPSETSYFADVANTHSEAGSDQDDNVTPLAGNAIVAAGAINDEDAPVADDVDEPSSTAAIVGSQILADAQADEDEASDDDSTYFQNTRMPWADSAPRNAEMAAIVLRADGFVRHGFQLAERGALYSARAEFIAALQLIARANDSQQGTQMYSRALSAGLVALRESADFVRQPTGRGEVEVAQKVSGHKTPLLKKGKGDKYTPMQASRCYYTYAQEQLAAAAAQEMCGSMALFGMGKTAMVTAGSPPNRQLEHVAEAMVLFQAALLAEPNNFRAANELAVLMAENGSFQRARDLLVRSVMLSPQAATWQNLAVVHAHLGEKQLADQAQAQAMAIQQIAGSQTGPSVVWLDPETFARTTPSTDNFLPSAPMAGPQGAPAGTAPRADKPAANVAKKGIFDWLPKNPLR